MDKPDLDLPDLVANRDPTLPLTERALLEWLGELPLTDIAGTTRQVYQKLQQTNRSELPARLRLALLASYAGTVEQIERGLSQYFVAQAHPLPMANRRVATSLAKVMGELATGYKVALMGGLKERVPQEILGQAAASAMQAAVDELAVCYQAYLPPTRGLWREMHEIYRWGLGALSSSEAVWQQMVDPYRRALLLELADPLRCSPAQWRLLCQVVDGCGQDVRLLAVSQGQLERPGVHTVAYAIDTGAVEPGDIAVRNPGQGCLLDTLGLLERLRDLIRCLEAGETANLAGRSLQVTALPALRRFAANYSRRPPRRDERVVDERELVVVRGIAALGKQLPGAWAGDDVEEVGNASDEHIDLSSQSQGGIDLESNGYAAEAWRQVDYSVGGAALLRVAGSGMRLLVGDALGINGLPGGAGWVLGVVRRIRYRREDELLIGVQLLAEQVKGVEVKYGSKRRRALLLRDGQERELLATQSGVYAPAAQLECLAGDNRVRPVTAGELLEASDQFELFALAA